MKGNASLLDGEEGSPDSDLDTYEEWPRERLLGHLAELDISRRAGFAIEVYRDRFSITPDTVSVFERYLISDVINNRSAALEALVIYGERVGYAIDALALNFLSRNGCDSEMFLSLRALGKMAKWGDAGAERALELLKRDQHLVRIIPYLDPPW